MKNEAFQSVEVSPAELVDNWIHSSDHFFFIFQT